MRILLLMPLALLASRAPAAAAPAADVVGNSVAVTWTENRQQRSGGRPEIRSVSVAFNLGIYISGARRPFTRLTLVGPGGRATNEQVGGQGESLSGGIRAVAIEGRTITLQAAYGNYARNLRIEVAPGGKTCSAQMTVGKQSGSTPEAFRSSVGGTVEIHSLTVAGTACSIQQGNIFAR